MELNPIVTKEDIWGHGGMKVDASSVASRRLRFLLLFPLERLIWLTRYWPIGERRLQRKY
jgi:hypothetical protein